MKDFFSWDNVFSLFKALNDAGINYLVLRNYEEMHNPNFFCDGHEDIDLLCDDVPSFVKVAHAVPKMWPEDTIHYVIFIAGQGIPIDVRCLGDFYYDNCWEESMLRERLLADNGNWYIMKDDDYYYSLVYHSILQKTQVSSDYINKLNCMAKKLGLNASTVEEHLNNLDGFMNRKNYQYTKPSDTSVPFYAGLESYYKSVKKGNDHRNQREVVHQLLAIMVKKIGAYNFLRNIAYDIKRSKFDNNTGRFRDIDKIAKKIMSKNGEDVYAQLVQRKIYYYLNRYDNEIKLMFDIQKKKLRDKKKQNCCGAVFTMWWQGIDEMPDIVKSCTNSLSRLGKTVVILTKDNIEDYISIPDYIWNKYKKGIISKTHLSDIIRVAVISIYGGIWIDATVYIAKEVPSYMTDKFFVFRQSPQLREVRSYANWWIAAPPANDLLIKQYSALLVYWKYESVLLDYYIFHIIWKRNLDLEPLYQNMMNGLLERYADTTHLLLRKYDHVYNEHEWKAMKEISPIFKCTYKWKGLSNINTYYSKLCMEKLP